MAMPISCRYTRNPENREGDIPLVDVKYEVETTPFLAVLIIGVVHGWL